MCRLIAKYRPSMPVLSVVIPRLKTNQLKWSFTGAFEVLLFFLCFSQKESFLSPDLLLKSFFFLIGCRNSQARQSLIVRGLFPMLADPRHPVLPLFSPSNHINDTVKISLFLNWTLKYNSSFHFSL